MKRLSASFFSLALVSCGLLFTNCEKQADAPAPMTAMRLVADSNGTSYAITSGTVGQVYPQGPGATGLSCYVNMRLINLNKTGNGETSMWQTDADSPAQCPSARQLTFHDSFEFNGFIYDVNTTTDPDGNVKMVQKFNEKRQ